MDKIDAETLMVWYREGRKHFDDGVPYEAPDNTYLRRAYATGYADAIMCTDTDEEELQFIVMG
jgi:hypothetical protein